MTTEEITKLDTEGFRAHLASLEPMQVAALFEDLSRAADKLKKALEKLGDQLEKTNELLLDLIIEEKLPSSFKRPSGANIHTQSQLWASAKGRNHAAVASVLRELAVDDERYAALLPKTVNSHSLSAYVREHLDENGEVVVQSDEHPDGIPQALLDVLNVKTVSTAKITGL